MQPILQVKFGGAAVDELLAEVNKQVAYRVRGEFSHQLKQQVTLIYTRHST
jgi:hypothetical protein